MPISTENCKDRLAVHFQAHPGLIREIFGDDPANDPDHSDFVTQAVNDAQVAAKWKREGKSSAKTHFAKYGGPYQATDGQMVVDYYDASTLTALPVSEVKTVRTFVLDPSVYDTSISYRVFEAFDGMLYIGEHVGD